MSGAGYAGPMNRAIGRTVAVLTPGTPGTAGRVISCKCSVAGDVTFTLAQDGSSLDEALQVGSNWFQLEVTQVDIPGGQPTTATFKNLS